MIMDGIDDWNTSFQFKVLAEFRFAFCILDPVESFDLWFDLNILFQRQYSVHQLASITYQKQSIFDYKDVVYKA